jgi:endonuclease G
MAHLKHSLLLLALAALLCAQHDRFGAPACSGAVLELADRSFFVLCHSSVHKVPVWVGYELLPSHLARVAARHSRFRADARLSVAGAADEDYRNSGFSRGHMAPAADFAWSDESMRATFLLSNAAPQRQSVNAGVWARLEAAVRRIAAESDAVYVFTGTLFGAAPETIGHGRVAVPGHTFKVVLALRGERRHMLAAIVPNSELGKDARLEHFMTTVDEVERRAGLDFFAALPEDEQRQLEAQVSGESGGPLAGPDIDRAAGS